MVSDLNKLGIALKSLDAMNLGTVGVNLANVEAYRTALKGLSVEQSVFALASKGATEEQIRQILVTNQATAEDVEAAMAKAGLTTATQALTQAEMVEMATKTGVAKATAEELLSKIGITATETGQIPVKKQVTRAMLEQAVASGTLTKAEASQIATMLGLNAVETTNIGITNVLTASFTKLWAVITAHPIGAILTAIGAVAVGAIAYINKTNKEAEEALVEAHENAKQALDDTKNSLSDDKSELQSVNSELETTKERLKEISSIGAPTLTEQNELTKLSTANAQLEAQQTLLENNIKLKQKAAALDAKELLGTQVEMEYSSILDGSSITSATESYSYDDHAKYQASNLKNAYNIYMKALRDGDVKKQQLAQELIDASAGDSAVLTSELLEIVESFKYDDGTIIEGYEDLYNEYMGMIYNLQSLTNPDTFLEIAKSVTTGKGIDYEKAISEAYNLAYEGNFDVASLNQDFVKALADAGIDESTISYIFKLKQQEYQLLVDKINSKYDSSKVQYTYWDGEGKIHHDYEKENSAKADVEKVNQELNEYARENPIEFQLVSSYDENFILLDKYIEEEKKKATNSADYVGDYVENAIQRIYDEAKVKSDTFNNEITDLTILSDIESLSTGLDQLDKIYADVKDKEGFDFSSLFTDDFKDTFGGFTTEYENLVKTITESPNDINACQDAFNDLATAYIYSTDALKNLNEENKDNAVNMLEQMGVSNADAIVTEMLTSKKLAQSLEEQALAITKDGVTDATIEQIDALLGEANASDTARAYLFQLVAAEQAFNNNDLDVSGKIEKLGELATAYGQTAIAAKIATWEAAAEASHTQSSYSEADLKHLQEEVNNAINTPIEVKYSGGSASSKGSKDSQKETEETFDWIETRLERLNEQSSDLADKFSKTFTLSSAESAYKDYLSAIGTEIEANNQAIAYYQQKLNEVGLAYEWIQKIQSGALSVDTITDENLINQINEYQSYYDKILSIQDTLKQLEEERLQAQLDYANKIIEQHEKEIKQAEKLMNFYKFIVDLKDTFGTLASRDDLRNEQYVSATQIEMLEEQNNQMMQLLYTVDYMSEAWQTYYDKIEENKESIKELTKELADLAIEMANLPIEKYNQYLDKNSNKNELYDAKLSNYTSVTSKNKTIDKQIALADKNNAKAQSTAKETEKNLEWASGQSFKDAWDMDYGKAVYYGQTAQAEQIKTYYAEIQKYVKSGKQVPSSLISQLSDGNYASLIYAVNNYNASLIANETAQATAKLSAEQTKTEKRTLQMAKFNNIQTKYERKQDDIAHKASTLSSKMDLAVAKGYLASQGWYEQLISYEKKNQSSLKKELTSLQAEFANMEKYTDEWWEMQDAIEDVTEAIYEGENALQEYKDALAQVKFDQFDYIQEQISRLTSEADFLIEAMSNKELKGDGGLTDYGLATMGLHKQNYDTYLSEAQKYGEMINKINEDLAKNPYDTDLINQLHEYEDAQRDCILAAEDEKKAIADLMKEGYDALINSLSDLISKYKEFIQNAKDAHDYQKNISEQSENINTLRKRISAYSAMSGNEEIAVKLQQANKELADAQENLEETMYDKYISDTQDALDDMLSELEMFVNELYQNIDELFRDGVKKVVTSTGTINQTLIDTASSFGTSYSGLSTAINDVWKNGYNFDYAFTQIITDLDTLVAASNAQYDKVADTEVYNSVKDKYKDMSGAESNISTAENNSAKLDEKAQDAKAKWETAKSQLADAKAYKKTVKKKYGTKSQQYKDAQALVDSAQANVDKLYKTYQRAQGVADASKLDITEAKMQYETLRRSNYNVVNDFLNGIANSQMDSTSLSSDLGNVINQITGGYIADYNVEQLAKLLGTSTDENAILDVLEKLGFQFVRGMTLSSNDIKGFATGGVGTLVKPNGEDGLAWVRNGEGFVSPENVADIQNLMRFVPDMSKFLNVTLPNYDNVIANRNIENNVTVDIGGIGDIYMSGVNDVNEFSKVLVKSIQDNSKVQNTISTLVNDSIMGKNSLGINRF